MRRIVAAIRSLIGLEELLIVPAYLGLAFIGWSIDWRIGGTILCAGLLAAGLLAAARPVPKE